jgi:glucose 1-dehydrogenase
MMLQKKVAIITGGDSGIGRAIVLALAQAGAAVALNYHRNQEAAAEVKRQVEQGGGKALAIQGDVASVADLQQLIDQTVQAFGRLDIMVNNAGMETRTSVLESSERDFDW